MILVPVIGFSVSPQVRAQAHLPEEYALKAAFLFNFAKFIDWPADNFSDPRSPFKVCVLGKDPFGNALDDNLQGKMIGNHPFAIRRLKDETEARSCQMLFVSSSELPHLAEILESLRGANILIIGETTGFATSGGTIEFTLEDGHVRFTINTDAANRAGLKFSAKLLSLAKIVHDEGHSKGG
jgi:YfiR/HmsC-like